MFKMILVLLFKYKSTLNNYENFKLYHQKLLIDFKRTLPDRNNCVNLDGYEEVVFSVITASCFA